MPLYITAFLLDQVPNGVITAVRLTLFTPTSVEDHTLFLNPAEQLASGRSISNLAICELAYTDLLTAQQILPVDPTYFVSIAEVSQILTHYLTLSDRVYMPDGVTAEALHHMLPALNHVIFPPTHYRPELDFFNSLAELQALYNLQRQRAAA